MLRVRLALVVAISLCFVFVLGFTLYWGSHKIALYSSRSQMAYEAFDRYQQLYREAYRYFKQRMDLLLVDRQGTAADVEMSRQRLQDAIERLRKATAKDIDGTGDIEAWRGRESELDSIARLSASLEAGMHRFDQVDRLRQEDRRDAALLLLSEVLEEDIDRKFDPLIDDAINREREQALVARERLMGLVGLSSWISISTALVSVVFSIAAGALLFRGIRKPIEALMRGTDEIAAGNLVYRIAIDSRDEFGYLAKHFNQMAQELEVQQRKLGEARAVLEQKVAERTLELNHLNGELQRMDHARRQFFADISHELRTPITVIRGEAEVTLRGRNKEAEEYKESLQRVHELSLQLGKLVNDLLFLARAETAHMQFEWETLDLAELVVNAAEDIRVLAQDKSIVVTLNVADTPVWVRGDKQRLRQIIFILGDNACRYSNVGGRIAIDLAADGTEATLRVNDHGIGIPAKDLEMIFDRYYRSLNARRSSDDGTGLGLPVAKAIVAAHGGQISADSAEVSGTTFAVTLPQVEWSESALAASAGDFDVTQEYVRESAA
ncbi:sensor histidine kinase [Methylocaldum sp.]|uniref:sensor histidine kinase n=1 Tax=Methylocaldum sp. TaxID=1969727 RepID=UPI002D2FBAC8|nr:ATP-binding protein [Methylocaldum sp.]HYE36426.1 ATP-binding protein [Methylocaldum sp.]